MSTLVAPGSTGVLAACLGCVAVPFPVMADQPVRVFGSHTMVSMLDTGDVQESSGLVASVANPDILWTMNDSGSSGPRVWAVRLSASDITAQVARSMGYVQLAGASNADWEDLAAGPGGTIYVFDGGDNPPCERSDKRIHRFTEPQVDPAGAPIALGLPFESIRIEYPDASNPALPADENVERYDAECLFVHPASGDIYIVTKRTNSDVGIARVYRLSAAAITWNSPAVHVLQFVTDLTQVLGVLSGATTTVTGGDIDPRGRRVLIRRYPAAYEFILPGGEPFEAIFGEAPFELSLSGEIQGESICYSADQGSILTTSEVLLFGGVPIGPARCPFFQIPVLLRPDFDDDGDVDQRDFGHLQRCFSGPSVAQVDPRCTDARLDGDLDVDPDDFDRFDACQSGPDIAAVTSCAP